MLSHFPLTVKEIDIGHTVLPNSQARQWKYL